VAAEAAYQKAAAEDLDGEVKQLVEFQYSESGSLHTIRSLRDMELNLKTNNHASVHSNLQRSRADT